MEDNLIRVKTYADLNKKTVQWAYQQIEKGKVESVKIDGVTFIKNDAK